MKSGAPIQVKDLMITDVVTIEATAPLLDALKLMVERKVKSVVIPPKASSDAYAILTFTDIAKKALAADERIEMLNVYDLMTKPAISVHQDWNIKYAARLLTNVNISRAIVMDGDKLVGIISLTDLVKSLVDFE